MPKAGKGIFKFAELPPVDYLRKHYHYDPQTGEFYAKPKVNKSENVNIGYKTYKKARIIWALHYGREPNGFVYFKDGDISNLAINNLEEGQCRMIREHQSYTRGRHLRKSKGQLPEPQKL